MYFLNVLIVFAALVYQQFFLLLSFSSLLFGVIQLVFQLYLTNKSTVICLLLSLYFHCVIGYSSAYLGYLSCFVSLLLVVLIVYIGMTACQVQAQLWVDTDMGVLVDREVRRGMVKKFTQQSCSLWFNLTVTLSIFYLSI